MSLNCFHFDLAIERGFFKEAGLDVKLLATKCDIAKRLLRGLRFTLKNRAKPCA